MTKNDFLKKGMAVIFFMLLVNSGYAQRLVVAGDNTYGQFGIGTTSTTRVWTHMTRIGTASNWKAIGCGNYHSLAMKTNGTLWAWGLNDHGQLGDSTTENKTTPVQVGNSTNWKQFDGGAAFTIAIKKDHTMWAWGDNSHGQLGDGTTTQQLEPQQIGSEKVWIQVTAGDNFAMALRCDGTVWFWGQGTGYSVPTQVGTDSHWKQVDAGGTDRYMLLKTDGTAWSATLSTTLTEYYPGNVFKKVDVGADGMGALATNGKVYGNTGEYYDSSRRRCTSCLNPSGGRYYGTEPVDNFVYLSSVDDPPEIYCPGVIQRHFRTDPDDGTLVMLYGQCYNSNQLPEYYINDEGGGDKSPLRELAAGSYHVLALERTPLPACNAPTEAATNLTFGTLEANSIQITGWTEPINYADGYVVKINTVDSFSPPANGTEPPAATEYTGGEQVVYFGRCIATDLTITGLEDGTTYYFKVYAYNDCNGTEEYEQTGLSGSASNNDEIPPVFTSITRNTPATEITNADVLQFTATFNEAVQNVTAGDFSVSGTTATVTGLSETNSSTYVLTVSGGDLASYNGTVGVGLAGGQDISDLAGNPLPNDQPATNQSYTLDNVAPALSLTSPVDEAAGVAPGTNLSLTFNENIVANSGNFYIKKASDSSIIQTIGITSAAVQATDSVLNINPPADLAKGTAYFINVEATAITDSAGNAFAGITDATTLNFSTVVPVVTGVTSTKPDGTYKAGDVIEISVTFDDDVEVTGTPRLLLETGDVDAVVNYDGNSSTATDLKFIYTVTVGDESADLDYTATNALTLNGGTINAAGGLTANITLPAPGEENSLSDNKNLVIDGVLPVLSSFTRFEPADETTDADTLIFMATFSEAVTGVDISDFEVNSVSTATITDFSSVSSTVYQIEVSGGDLENINATVGLNLKAGHGIQDNAGNALPTAEPAIDETYNVSNGPEDGGIIAETQTICYATAPDSLTSTTLPGGYTGLLEYKWQYSNASDTTDFTDISNSNAAGYQPGTLTDTTWFKRLARVENAPDWADAVESNVVKITVYDAFTPGAIETTGETICYNGNPEEIVSSTDASGGDENITYAWYSSTDNFGSDSSLIFGATLASYNPPTGLTETTAYRRYAKDGTCNTVLEMSAGTWTVTVYDDFTPGTIATTGETICYSGDPEEIGSSTDASGGNESITYAWYKSTDDFADSTLISGATLASYNPPTGFTETTSYRRYAKDGICNTVLEMSTGTWTVTVYDAFTPGAIETTGETLCYGGDPEEIGSETDSSGGDETITYAWYKSTDDFADSTLISGATLKSYDPPTGLTETTSYRRYAKDGTCNTVLEMSAGTWEVTVEPLAVVGNLTKSPDVTEVCIDDNVSATLTAGSGGNGTDELEYRTYSGTSWSSWTNYTSGTDISTTGKTEVEVRTWRTATYCDNSDTTTVGWATSPQPVANAGSDATITEFDTYTLSSAGAGYYSSVSWTTDGDGTFSNINALKPVYTPGSGDLAGSGMVELCLTAEPETPCTVADEDCMTLRICRCPSVVIVSPTQKEVLYQNPVTVTGTSSDPDNNVDFIEVRLNGGDWQTATGTTSWSIDFDLLPGKNTIEVRATDLSSLKSGIEEVEVTLSIQIINIPQGWSYISSYLDPTDPDVVNMWADIVGANHLAILTGVNGIYAPDPFFINTFGNWDVMKGYKVSMKAQDELLVTGDSLTDKTVDFLPGVHLIPVLTNQTTGLDMVFDNPETDILYLLDIYSNLVYWPIGGLYTLTDLVPGKGYLANFKNPVTLTYPPLSNFTVDNAQNLPPAPGPWVCIRTSNVHLISVSTEAISQLQNADYIGAFDSQGNCVGYSELEKTGQNILLTVYGNEPMTNENDGILEGETIYFRAYNSLENAEKEITAIFKPSFPNTDGLFYANGLSGISGFKESATGVWENDLAASVLVYPNPAKDVVNIVFTGLRTIEGFGTLLTAEGKLVKAFEIKNDMTRLDISDLIPGIYILKIESTNSVVLKRVVIQ